MNVILFHVFWQLKVSTCGSGTALGLFLAVENENQYKNELQGKHVC
jgi:hypothetical protein